MHITSRSCCLQTLGTDFHKHPQNGSESGDSPQNWSCMRSIVQVRGHRLHNIRDNPLPCQKKAVILHSHSALGSHSRQPSSSRTSLTKVSSRVRDFKRSASPPLPIRAQSRRRLWGPQRKRIACSSDDALHAHRTFIALPSHVRTHAIHKRTWCFLRMQVDK